jgi:heme exporter protein B
MNVISGIGLYLLSLVFICYLTFSYRHNIITAITWSALFWLTILFAVINSVAKTFIGEKAGRLLYFYALVSPQAIILSKIIYNAILCMALSVSAFILFAVFISNPIENYVIFISGLMLASIGFSAALSLMSAIASKASNSNILMAVLSFPILISILLMSVKLTINLLDKLDPSTSYDELLNLTAINCILTGLAYILFPYIWRS